MNKLQEGGLSTIENGMTYSFVCLPSIRGHAGRDPCFHPRGNAISRDPSSACVICENEGKCPIAKSAVKLYENLIQWLEFT